MIRTREKMRPYVAATMAQARKSGRPPIRPVFFDFGSDATAAAVEDAFMFGDDLLVAPIVAYKARSRRVYLPSNGTTLWASFWDSDESKTLPGGAWIDASAPLERIPVFRRIEGAQAA